MISVTLPWVPFELSNHAKGNGVWTESDKRVLRDGYRANTSVQALSSALGRSKGSIRNKAYELGITTRDYSWSDKDLATLKDAYASADVRGKLKHLPATLGRSASSISCKARRLGMTDGKRPQPTRPKVDRRKYQSDEERKVARSVRMRERHASQGHHMLGKHHTDEAKAKIALKSRAYMASLSKAEIAIIRKKAMKTTVARHGSLAPKVARGSWKAGWREISGYRKFYRSRWEANYARYLNWLHQRGEILDWKHEPETFWFDKIKRGVRSYLPDFRVWELDGSSKLHEVKGWMDSRSKTTLNRMRIYHPCETIVLIERKAYEEIEKKLGRIIEGWE